jgi:hypothetical protein
MPEIIRNIWDAVTTKVIAGLITCFLAWLFTVRFRSLLIIAFARIIGSDLVYIYPTRDRAKRGLLNELCCASFVDLLTGRGFELQTEGFAELLGDRPRSRTCKFRVLLPTTTNINQGPDWTDINDHMMAVKDASYGSGLLKEQLAATRNLLEGYEKHGLVEVREFNTPHVGRILITDRYAYFNPYNERKHAHNNPVLCFRAGGMVYEGLRRYFNLLWDNPFPRV